VFADPPTEGVTDEPPLGASTMLTAPDTRDDNRDFDPAPLPTFLNARSPRATRATSGYEPVDEGTTPVTDASGARSSPARRDGDDDGDGDSGGDGGFARLLTVAAVLIILALGVATVLIVPGLLAGNPGLTPRPSLVAGASRPPTSLATSVAVGPTLPPDAATVPPTSEVPTPVATPTPTPRAYRIQAGDRLRQIARDHGVTVEQILAANPEISDPNDIQVGQRILIPTP
jgi:LysM repeat protein